MDRYPPPYPPLVWSSAITDGIIAADLPCRRCQYNLRTLAVSGLCPECGLSVTFSAQPDLLRYSDPRWVLTLRRGALCTLWGVAVFISGMMLALVLVNLEGHERNVSAVVAAVTALSTYVLFIVGGWLLTTPDPSGLGENRYRISRMIVRITLILGAAGQLLPLILPRQLVPDVLRVLFGLLLVLTQLAGVAGMFAQLHYIGKLAERIPDNHIVARARAIKLGLAITLCIFFVGAFCMALVGGGVGGVCFLLLFLVALMIFGLMYLFMLGRLSSALKEQAQSAMQSWHSGTAAPSP